MLHMVVNTHSEDSCAFRNDENREALAGGFGRFGEAAAEHGAELIGAWANMASHTVFLLVDAPTAHVVDEILRGSELVGHTDSRVYAVETMATALAVVSE